MSDVYRIYSEQQATARALEYLLDKPQKRIRPPKRGKGGERGGDSEITGAHVHLQRTSAQAIATATDVAVSWNAPGPIAARNFEPVSFPSTSVRVIIPGYYNVNVLLALAEPYAAGGSVYITRTRGGSQVTVWPLPSEPDIWTADDGRRFEGTAHAIPCLAGDEFRVYVSHNDAGSVDLTSATLAAYLVDRITQADPWELVFPADNWGVTWDGDGWWTTDDADNASPALFDRSPDGTILNSYGSYISEPTGVDRNRGIVYAGGFLWGVGSSSHVYKIDPTTGTEVSNFFAGDPVSPGGSLQGIAWNGSSLFVVELSPNAGNPRVEQFSTGGTEQAEHSFPSGRSLRGLTWDGAHFWATTATKDIVRMNASFGETLAIDGPRSTNHGIQFRDGYLYVMTDEGLFRKAV